MFLSHVTVAEAQPLARCAFLLLSPGAELDSIVWGVEMILAAIVAASLIVPVSVDRSAPWPPPRERGPAMSLDQNESMVEPLVLSATECIARTVSADPRFQTAAAGAEFNNLIVDSVPSCADNLRNMIETYDRLFGDGAGESFFMGSYLDGLPAAVNARVKRTR